MWMNEVNTHKNHRNIEFIAKCLGNDHTFLFYLKT